MTDDHPVTFWARSMYGAMTDRPIVSLGWAGQERQVSPAEARTIALSILEAAESADSDAFLFQYARSIIGADTQSAGQLLIEFREWRDRRRKRESEP